MNSRNRVVRLAALLALGAITTAGCATRPAPATTHATVPGLAQRVEQARTPADHAALAEYFEARAAAEDKLADECRSLRDRFGRAAALPEVRDHYRHLMESHRRNAGDYRALARVHRRAAQAVPQTGD